jgi:hypothetical protein
MKIMKMQTSCNMNRFYASVLTAVLMAASAGPAWAVVYTFTDQTPTTPIISGDYQRYVSLLGDGTNLALWYENRTTGGIDMRTSTTGYTGFGSPTATSGLSGLSGHPRIYGSAGAYTGFFWQGNSSLPPNGIARLTSTDGLSWGDASQISVSGSLYPTSNIWGVVGYFENVSGATDVLYYTQATGANENVYRATATDGVHFTYQNTAFLNPGGADWGAGVSVDSQICYDAASSQYLLIWSGESTVGNIGYATSSDGVSFTNLGTVIATGTGHSDLQESSFVINGSSIVGVYTGDFSGVSSNHIGAFTGAVVPEPGTLVLLVTAALTALGYSCHRRRS